MHMKMIFGRWGFWLVFIVQAMVGGGTQAIAEGKTDTDAVVSSGNHIAIVAVGNIDQAEMDRVLENVKTRLTPSVQVLPPRKLVGGVSMGEEAAALKELKGEGVLGVVGIVEMGGEVEAHGTYFPDLLVGVVNYVALGADQPSSEVLSSRLQKETLRAVGLIAGMQPCPLFLCAMYHNKTLSQLDKKGHGPCPPCFDTIFKPLADERGMVHAEHPFGAP